MTPDLNDTWLNDTWLNGTHTHAYILTLAGSADLDVGVRSRGNVLHAHTKHASQMIWHKCAWLQGTTVHCIHTNNTQAK